MRHITKQKALERVKSSFLSIASHELKTPLTSIKSFSEMLLDEDLNTKTQREFIKVINDESDRLTRLLEDLLTVSRLDLDKRKINKQILTTKNVLEKILLEFKVLSEKNGVVITFDISDICQQIIDDKNVIEQVMINLLSNAIKYSPQGGKIKIEVKRIGYEELPDFLKRDLPPRQYIFIWVWLFLNDGMNIIITGVM